MRDTVARGGALTWVGSGALAAFDRLELLLFAVFRPDTSEAGWSLTDAATATKVVTGVLAAAAGVLALASAARDGNVDSSDEGPDHAHGQQTPGPLPIQ